MDMVQILNGLDDVPGLGLFKLSMPSAIDSTVLAPDAVPVVEAGMGSRSLILLGVFVVGGALAYLLYGRSRKGKRSSGSKRRRR